MPVFREDERVCFEKMNPSAPAIWHDRLMTSRDELDRRGFLVGTGNLLCLASLCLGGCSSSVQGSGEESGASSSTGADDDPPVDDTSTSAGPPGGASTSGDATDAGADVSSGAAESSSTGVDPGSSETGSACEPSPSDIEGPFYREGIPVGGDLDVHGDRGVPLVLAGRVLGTDCQPIAGAVVEIWHATPTAPDAEPGDVDATYDESEQFRYYGQLATDPQGNFEFRTLRPGWYLNGENYRPAHVHVKVWVGRIERLTTQLYFADDPFNDADPWFTPEMALEPDASGHANVELVV